MLPLLKTDNEVEETINACITILCIACMLYLSLAIMYFQVIDAKMWNIHIILAIPLIFLTCLNQLYYYLLIKRNNFSRIAMAKTVYGVSLAIIPLFFGIFYTSSTSLLFALLTSLAISVYVMWPKKIHEVKLISIKKCAQFIKSRKKYPLVIAPSAAINAAGVELPLYIISSLFGAATGGYYSMALRAIQTPVGVITKAWGAVFYREISIALNDGAKNPLEIYNKNIKTLAFSSLFVYAVVYIFGKDGITLLLGESWALSGDFLMLMIPMLYLMTLSSPFSQTLNASGSHFLQFLWDCFRLVIIAAVYFIGINFSYSLNMIITMLTTVISLAYFLHICLCFISLKNTNRK